MQKLLYAKVGQETGNFHRETDLVAVLSLYVRHLFRKW